MRALDRYLQRRRLRQIRPYVPAGGSLLDVGCADGALRRACPDLGEYVGIDPALPASVTSTPRTVFVKGRFPDDLPVLPPLDAIAMAAVLEHIPADQQRAAAESCLRLLRPGGRLLITTPSPRVDGILRLLRAWRLVETMKLEQHYGFDPAQTPAVFEGCGFRLLKWRRFQFGLNHLFVFEKP